jgi:hypothetical protein
MPYSDNQKHKLPATYFIDDAIAADPDAIYLLLGACYLLRS